jgi:aconitate hydratase 2/2-methylisocitrate dehydratase
MNTYLEYTKEIEERRAQGLSPKPIDGDELLAEIIEQIKDTGSEYRADALQYFIYNTLPGTTSAAGVKAKFLKEIILGESPR